MILRRTLLWAVGMAALLLFTSPALAGLPPPPSSPFDRIRDLSVSVRARRVLKEDAELASLNLGVSVENGIASVWGPVPSTDVARRAISKLQNVRGVREVRTNFYSESPQVENLLGDLIQHRGAATRIDVGKPDLDSGKLLVKVQTPVPVVGSPGTEPVSTPKIRIAGQPTTAVPTASVPRAAVPMAAVPTATVSTRNDKGTPQSPTLAERVIAVRRSDDRFATVGITISGTRLTVHQSSAPDDVIRDLLTQLRRVSGVSEIQLSSN